MKASFYDIPKKKALQKAIIVGAYSKKDINNRHDNHLDELASLCRTAGARVVGRLIQFIEHFNPATLIGSGKVDELSDIVDDLKADIVVFDTLLSPSQQVNLEKRLNKPVIDRPALILDIFALHAKSREAQTQVELAQMQYLLPRLAGGWTHLERQEGVIGTRGPGETQLETDRRLVRKRISDLNKKLKEIEAERFIQRKKRSSLCNVCFVGYTNAGKSTLFNLLTGSAVVAEDYLFATLDSTTRRIKLSGKNEILLSDTVGFIKKLPVSLVASFKSTLMEASEADLLLHVVDISDDDFENHISVVNGVLNDIGCQDIPVLPIFNKIDRRNDPDLFRNIMARYKGAKFTSALSGDGISKLKADIESFLELSYVTVLAKIPSGDKEKITLMSSLGQILDSQVDGANLNIKARILEAGLGKLRNRSLTFEVLKIE